MTRTKVDPHYSAIGILLLLAGLILLAMLFTGCASPVAPLNPPTVRVFSATQPDQGGHVNLYWDTANATTCTMTPTGGEVPCTGERTVTVPPNGSGPTSYTLHLVGNGGTTDAVVKVFALGW